MSPTLPPQHRYDSIDVLRGAAIVWMTVFHFCFDLSTLGFWRQNFYADPFWTNQRTAIVSLFLFCAGLGQAVAVAQSQSWPRFWKRWTQVAVCALLVSAGSALMFPNSYIFFGVLHGIAVMLIIARLTAGWGRWLWLAGAVALALPWLVRATGWDALNGAPWNVLGLVTRRPITEDYVPVFPWLGVLWWGMAAGQWLLQHRGHMLGRPMPKATAPLSWLGRWSLSWYMLHQPVLIGTLLLLRWMGVR